MHEEHANQQRKPRSNKRRRAGTGRHQLNPNCWLWTRIARAKKKGKGHQCGEGSLLYERSEEENAMILEPQTHYKKSRG